MLKDRLRRLFTWRRLLEAALVVAVFAGVHLYQTRGLPEGAAPPLEGVMLDGRAVKVSDGGTPALVAFWATWCPVCKAEEDNLVALARDHRVISVAMQSGDAAAVAKHLKELGLDLPTLVDEDGRHAFNWRVRGVPTHFVVDAAGNVRFRVVGYATTWGLRARLWWAATFPAAAPASPA